MLAAVDRLVEVAGLRGKPWATHTLQRRAIGWTRRTRGRTKWTFGDGHVHERERPRMPRRRSASTPTIPREVDWSTLSPRSTAILRLIAMPISEGYSLSEVARGLGTTRRWVLIRLDELRDELERLSV